MRDKDIAKHPLTHPGRSSFEALFGRPPRLAVVASRHCLIARLPLLLWCSGGMSRSFSGSPQGTLICSGFRISTGWIIASPG